MVHIAEQFLSTSPFFYSTWEFGIVVVVTFFCLFDDFSVLYTDSAASSSFKLILKVCIYGLSVITMSQFRGGLSAHTQVKPCHSLRLSIHR